MVKQVILAFIGSMFPAILFNLDKKKMVWAGLSGAIGWAVYLIAFNYFQSPVAACFIGTIALGIYSEIMARKLRTPSMELSLPGMFPLVPGLTAYNTIIAIVEQRYAEAYDKGLATLAIAGAIAFGIMMSSTAVRFIIGLLNLRPKKKKISE